MKKTKWLPLSKINPNNFPINLKPWLIDPLSMTARFKRVCGDKFYLKLLSQSEAEVSSGELAFLGLKPARGHVIREIEMGGDAIPWLFGRSVFPENLFEGRTAEYFRDLGGKPLGEILFKDPMLTRTEFEIALICPSDEEYKLVENFIAVPIPVWARRSLFNFMQKKIMLTEIFLPTMPFYSKDASSV
ncbi:MAG: chorismate lyase [Gammaproteobacteria bacterium]|nr:chorismate lyase [Gammaproteobacteria bacterium]